MLTIQNKEKIMGKYVTIKGYSFIVDKPIETPSKYIIGITPMSTTFAPMTITLNRDEGCNTYQLRKVGNNNHYVELSMEDMENQRVFLRVLENYLNSL
jgi:hypothetical protein